MSETTKSSKSRRVLVVTNRGSDSDGSDEYEPRLYTSYPNPLAAQLRTIPPSMASHSFYSGKNTLVGPAPLITNHYPDNVPYHLWSNPALSSPSSTSSRAIESTPPPVTPGLSSPPVDTLGESPSAQESSFLPGFNERGEFQQPPFRSGPQPAMPPSVYPRPTNQLPPRTQPISSPGMDPVC
jgi:hypothetical protein